MVSARAWRVLSPLAGLAFVAIGGAKLNGDAATIQRFAEWGFDPWFIVVAGMAEVVLGLLLFFAPTRGFGAAGLAAWMIGAVFTHLRAGEATIALLPITLFVLFTAGAAHELRRKDRRIRPPAPLHDPPVHVLPALLFVAQVVGVSFLLRWAVGGIGFWLALPLLALGHAHVEGALRDRSRARDAGPLETGRPLARGGVACRDLPVWCRMGAPQRFHRSRQHGGAELGDQRGCRERALPYRAAGVAGAA